MLLVIEGLDGAGKSTQVAKIQAWLESSGRKWEYLHFPRFTAPVYGDLIARFLRGDLGALNQVDPRLVALIYAGDRAEAAGMIRGWLNDGRVVILDRYVYSNIAYQCAKIADQQREGRSELMSWILELEYGFNGIPKPDLSLFLDVPFVFTERSLTADRAGDDRLYLNGKQDIHEADLSFQRRVREVYMQCASSDDLFRVVDCSDHATSSDPSSCSSNSVNSDVLVNRMMSPDDIFKKIQDEITHFL